MAKDKAMSSGVNYKVALKDIIGNGGDCTIPEYDTQQNKATGEWEQVFIGTSIFTLEKACLKALNFVPEREPLSVEESGKRYDIIKKIRAGEELTLSDKEKINEISPKVLPPAIAGQIKDLLK